MVAVTRTEGECRAVPIRMRTVKEEKKGSSKKEDGEEQRAQRRRPQQRECAARRGRETKEQQYEAPLWSRNTEGGGRSWVNNRVAGAENGAPSAAATVKPGVLCAVRACTLWWGRLRPPDLSLGLRGAPDGNLWLAVCGDSPRGGRTA